MIMKYKIKQITSSNVLVGVENIDFIFYYYNVLLSIFLFSLLLLLLLCCCCRFVSKIEVFELNHVIIQCKINYIFIKLTQIVCTWLK